MNKSVPDSTAPLWNEAQYHKLSHLLAEKRGFSIVSYKDGCIARRIISRINATNSDSLENYLELVKGDDSELDALVNALTINVSSFYRNREVFEYVAQFLFPEIIKKKKEKGERVIKVWSSGCATGEEPYTIALLCQSQLKVRLKGMEVKILATDIDKGSLERAKKGEYSSEKIKEIPTKTIRSFFSKKEKGYKVRDILREMIEFRYWDLLAFKPIHERFDIIFCRNMLIYCSEKNHVRAYRYFSDSLKGGGYLVLGRTEIMFFPHKNGFEHGHIGHRIYQKKR